MPIYIQNMSPHKVLEDKTPEKAFIRVKMEVGLFCIFRCLIYIYVPLEETIKVHPSTYKSIFVGYSEISKAYMVYIPSQGNTVVSRDVRFEES